MNQRDLAYWLQGYFEIIGDLFEDLGDAQWTKIRNHIKLVEHTEGGSSPLTIGLHMACDTKNADFAKKLVSSHFEHVLDPQDKEPDKAQIIHDNSAQKPSKPSTLVRC